MCERVWGGVGGWRGELVQKNREDSDTKVSDFTEMG